jgi:hypothetical protein
MAEGWSHVGRSQLEARLCVTLSDVEIRQLAAHLSDGLSDVNMPQLAT